MIWQVKTYCDILRIYENIIICQKRACSYCCRYFGVRLALYNSSAVRGCSGRNRFSCAFAFVLPDGDYRRFQKRERA